MTEIGNHGLCGAIARLLEGHKIEKTMTVADKQRLAEYQEELVNRIELALAAPEPAPLTMEERIERHD